MTKTTSTTNTATPNKLMIIAYDSAKTLSTTALMTDSENNVHDASNNVHDNQKDI